MGGIGVWARGRCPEEKGGIERVLESQLDVIGETMLWTSLQSDVMDIIGEATGGQWSLKLYKKGLKKKIFDFHGHWFTCLDGNGLLEVFDCFVFSFLHGSRRGGNVTG